MAWSAYWMLIVTTVGVVVLIFTLRASNKTINEARNATLASQALVEIESTPFIFIELLKPESNPKKHSNLDPNIQCVIKNVGRGAGIVTQITRRWVVKRGMGAPDKLDPSNGIGVAKEFNIPVGPSSQTAVINSLSNEHRSCQFELDSCAFFYGSVVYTNASGKEKFETGFCYMWRWDQPELGFHIAAFDNAKNYTYHRKIT